MDLKKMLEEKNDKIEKMQGILDKAKAETRALEQTEIDEFEKLKAEVKNLEKTISAAEEVRSMQEALQKTSNDSQTSQDQKKDLEYRAFDAFLRGQMETRADFNLIKSENGAIIPQTIANRIIQTLENICPIYNMTTKYNINGDLIFPLDMEGETVDGKTISKMEAVYAEEFAELESQATKFSSEKLGGYLIGALTKISLSLVKNSQFDLVSYVIGKIALAYARKLEKECLFGTENKMTGVVSTANKITAAKAGNISADDLIDLQDKIMDSLQAKCCWIMNSKTRKKIRKLKNNEGEYLLNRDLRGEFGNMLLGKPIYTSDIMPDVEAGSSPIFYGDPSGLYVNIHEGISMQILQEKYATQHAVGIVAWAEIDSKIIEKQKLAKLTMPAGEGV